MNKEEKYDRALQLEILNTLIAVAPESLSQAETYGLQNKFHSYPHFVANMLYLEMHELVSDPFIRTNAIGSGQEYLFNANSCAITEKGIDFLLDDGGLGAILKVQTVRIHNDTLIALEDIIRVANIPEDQQRGMIHKLRDLPGDAIKHLTLQLLSQGVINLPAALPLIQKALHLG